MITDDLDGSLLQWRVPMRREGRHKHEGEDTGMREKTQKRSLCEDSGRDWCHSATLKKLLEPPEAKGQGKNSLQKSRGMWPCRYLDLAQWYWFQTSGLQNCERVNSLGLWLHPCNLPPGSHHLFCVDVYSSSISLTSRLMMESRLSIYRFRD